MAEEERSKTQEVEPQETEELKECFVIMPISDPDGYATGHFERVYKDIFVPAINKAGFKPCRADDDKATNLIHLEILKKIIACPIVLCDLSARNPNVLFELGLRQAFDLPVVLVQEIGTPRIFDITGIRCADYRKEKIYHEVIEDQNSICEVIQKTFANYKQGTAVNSLIRLLSIPSAKLTTSKDIKTDPNLLFVLDELSNLRHELQNIMGFQRTERLRRASPRPFGLETEYKTGLSMLAHCKSIINKKQSPELSMLNDMVEAAQHYRQLYNATDEERFLDLANRLEELPISLCDASINVLVPPPEKT